MVRALSGGVMVEVGGEGDRSKKLGSVAGWGAFEYDRVGKGNLSESCIVAARCPAAEFGRWIE